MIEYLTFENVFKVIILLASAYIIYYLRQKGENLATKEDLGTITEIVSEAQYPFDISLTNKETANSILVYRLEDYNKRISNILFDILEIGINLSNAIIDYQIPVPIAGEKINVEHNISYKKLAGEYNKLVMYEKVSLEIYEEEELKSAITDFMNSIRDTMSSLKRYAHELTVFNSTHFVLKGISSDKVTSDQRVKYTKFVIKNFTEFNNEKVKLEYQFNNTSDVLTKRIIEYYKKIESSLEESSRKNIK